MANKTKKRPKNAQPMSEEAELLSFLPSRQAHGKSIPNVPYLKSFMSETPERNVNGSKLIYTACSDKKWTAPGTTPARRNFA